MRPPNKLLVSLDLTELDTNLLRYASYLCEKMPVQELVLIHNLLISEPPEELKSLYPELEEPLEMIVEREIEEKLNQYLHKKDLEITVNIFQNENIDEIVKWVRSHEIDLSLVGKKTASEGQGFFSRQYLRLTSHPVILIPPSATPEISNILAPVDFSSNAVNVIRTAHQMEVSLGVKVSYLHLYVLPPKYFPYVAKSMDKYQQEYLTYARKEFKKWKEKSIKDEQTGEAHYQMAERNDIAREVYLWAVEHHVDLIICGAKGKSDAEVLLLGSVSEKLITTDYHIPLMVVKRKEHYGWLEKLLD
jgi:nucleotide-binding universal stress UspA family protein